MCIHLRLREAEAHALADWDAYYNGKSLLPIACLTFRYTPAIEATNEKLKAYARLHTRVDFVDCSAPFLEDDDKVIFPIG